MVYICICKAELNQPPVKFEEMEAKVEEYYEVWSVHPASGRPDRCVESGSLEDCESYMGDANDAEELRLLDQEDIDAMTRTEDGVLYWH